MITIEVVSNNFSNLKNEIKFKICNHFEKSIWLVSDNWMVWKKKENYFEISFARELMTENVRVFDYFLPNLIMIKPHEVFFQSNIFYWPYKLNTIWNKDSFIDFDEGYEVLRAKFGYGFTPKIKYHSDKLVEENIMLWQQYAYSNEFIIYVKK